MPFTSGVQVSWDLCRDGPFKCRSRPREVLHGVVLKRLAQCTQLVQLVAFNGLIPGFDVRVWQSLGEVLAPSQQLTEIHAATCVDDRHHLNEGCTKQAYPTYASHKNSQPRPRSDDG